MFRSLRWPARTHVRVRYAFVAAFLIACQALAAPPAMAQEMTRDLRRFTLTAGLGNPMGWVGAQGEAYFARERLSGFLGLGYTPEFGADEPSGPTVAAGMRAYTAGGRHRGYAELSISQVLTVQDGHDFVDGEWVPDPGHRLYGPGLQLGYQYASFAGFTVQASLGAGYAPTADESDLGFSPYGKLMPMAALGFGYTWR